MADIYLSYNRVDGDAARRIASRLSAEGFSVFFDSVAIVGGESFSDRIRQEIENAKAVLALLSSQSRKSSWVGEELQTALRSSQFVLPVLLDRDAKDNWLWPLLADRHSVVVDFSSTYSRSQLDQLVRVLSERIGKQRRSRSRRTVLLWAFAALALFAALAWLFIRFGQ
jgi:hypothetical protein